MAHSRHKRDLPQGPGRRQKQAAQYLTDNDVPTSERTIPERPIPYYVINGKKIFFESDLDAYIANVKAGAARRMGTPRSGRLNQAPRIRRDSTDAGSAEPAA